jgi:hypothetical protein
MWTSDSAGGPWRRPAPRRASVPAARRVGSRVPALLASTLLTVVLGACGTSDPGAADVAVLADRADRLAEHLDAEDGCLAEREGTDLVARALDAVAAESLSQEVADEIVAVVDEVTSAVPCEDDVVTEEEREAAEEADDEGPEEAEEPPEEGGNDSEEGPGQGNGESGPPGRSEQGPPGQRGNSGRGRG